MNTKNTLEMWLEDNSIDKMIVVKDGNNWCFVLPDFENLQVSPSVWTEDGDTDIDAIYAQLNGKDLF
jgi:hypothetical protein